MARVLVVDDQREMRQSVRRVLSRMGHEVVEAADGREALAALATPPIDLVVTDLNMPEMDGIELILSVTDRWPSMPIIAISGGGLLPKELLLDNAAVLGALTALPKPLDLDALRDAVTTVLRQE